MNGQNEPMSRSNGDSPDDFELVSEANLEAMLASLQAVGATVSEASNRPVNDRRNEVKPFQVQENRSNEIMDAADIYELIQKEHKLLKGA